MDFDFMLEQLPNDTLKGDIVARSLGRANSYEEVLQKMDKYGQFLKTSITARPQRTGIREAGEIPERSAGL